MNRHEARKAALRIAALTLGAVEDVALAEAIGLDLSDTDSSDVQQVSEEIGRITNLLWKWEGGA